MKLKTLILLMLVNIGFTFAQTNEEIFIAKPYLQIGRNPDATSLELLWHVVEENADWLVKLQTTENGKWQNINVLDYKPIAVANLAPHRVYHAKLTGLISGSSFNYKIYKNNKIVFSASGKAPKSNTQDYKFVVFGDIGAETIDQKLLAHQAFKSNPDLVVVPGDIVYEYGLISEYRSKFWNIYNADQDNTLGAPIMRTVPFVTAPGNHDTDVRDLDKYPDALAYFMFWQQPLNGPRSKDGTSFSPELKASEANKDAFLAASAEAYPNMANYSFNYGNAHYTIIDSNPYVDWTNQTLLDWVKNDLKSATDATWKFVIYHHPGFTSSLDHFEQQQMRLLSPIFDEAKVDVVFNGHVHNYQRSFPLTFTPDKIGTLLVGGKDLKTVRGRIVNGHWILDKKFDGIINTHPKGTIYIVTGAGGQELYDINQTTDPDSWQKFTDKFISTVHSLTEAKVHEKTLEINQISAEGILLDHFVINK